jgi:hypothetical protein
MVDTLWTARAVKFFLHHLWVEKAQMHRVSAASTLLSLDGPDEAARMLPRFPRIHHRRRVKS